LYCSFENRRLVVEDEKISIKARDGDLAIVASLH